MRNKAKNTTKRRRPRIRRSKQIQKRSSTERRRPSGTSKSGQVLKIYIDQHTRLPSTRFTRLRSPDQLKPEKTASFRSSYFNGIKLLWNNLYLLKSSHPPPIAFKAKRYQYYLNKLHSDLDVFVVVCVSFVSRRNAVLWRVFVVLQSLCYLDGLNVRCKSCSPFLHLQFCFYQS